MIRVTKIKNGIEPGTVIPERQQNGNVGRWAEAVMEINGHNIEHGAGCDMPEYGVEMKTRKIESNSPHTVGTMRFGDIISKPYDQSLIFEKFQRQYRVHYSDEGQVVLTSEVYDLTEEFIQSKIREAYEEGRKQITQNEINGFHPPYVKGSEWGYFEVSESYSSYRFRIPNSAMKKIETAVRNAKTFKKLFE
jgi:hypothetical protein